MEGYPDSQDQIIRDLRADVERLKTQVRDVTGLVIRKSSGAFFVPNVTAPATPSSGFEMYGAGGEPAFKTSAGLVVTIPNPFVPANDVTNPAAFAAGTAPASYSQSYMQGVADAAEDAISTLTALLNSLRASGIIA